MQVGLPKSVAGSRIIEDHGMVSKPSLQASGSRQIHAFERISLDLTARTANRQQQITYDGFTELLPQRLSGCSQKPSESERRP